MSAPETPAPRRWSASVIGYRGYVVGPVEARTKGEAIRLLAERAARYPPNQSALIRWGLARQLDVWEVPPDPVVAPRPRASAPPDPPPPTPERAP
jgi:hypothetical protein